MTTTGGNPGTKRGGTGTIIAIVAVLAAFVVVGLLTTNTKTDVPYDPTSTSPNGTRALVDLVQGFGASVDVPDRFPTDADVAVLFEDVVPTDEVQRVHDWVRSGHTLVVTDPRSDFTPRADVSSGGTKVFSPTIDRGTCTIDALRGVGQVDQGVSSSYDLLFLIPVTDAAGVVDRQAQVCFATDQGAFVTVQPEGKGQIVSVASGAPFLNRYLGRADNAVLAVDLLAPTPGTRVALLTDQAFGVGGGGGGGLDVLGSVGRVLTPGLRLLLFQLGLAVVVYGLARGRRLGRPVAEPQPVQIAGSELVSAVGNLLQQLKSPDSAGVVLRADLRRRLCDRLGLPRDAPAEIVAETVAARTGHDRELVLTVLTDRPITDDRGLVELAQQIDTVREEILHGHAP